MAVTAIWGIKGSIDRLIDYAVNPEKTVSKNSEDIADLHAVDAVIDYAANVMKTEESRFVTGINIDPVDAKTQFKKTKIHYNKTGGIVAFHAYQSFAPGEVDAETAHKIGIELAKRLWNDYEVIVATHCNTGCYHNHFVINSVSLATGKKYNDCKETYSIMREESDKLCREYGLSVIADPSGRGKNYAEWQAERDGRQTVRGIIRQAIDTAVKGSTTTEQFLDAMDQMGFVIVQTGKYPKIKQVGSERFVRFRSLGEGYDVEDIIRRISLNDRRMFPRIPEQVDPQQIFEGEDKPVAIMTFVPMYRCYKRALDLAVERPYTNRKIFFLVRQDTSAMRLYSDSAKLVCEHDLHTAEDVIAYKQSAMEKIEEYYRQRQKERSALRQAQRTGNAELAAKAKYNIGVLTRRMSKLRREVTTCGEVIERSGHVRNNLTRIKQEKFKGKEEIGYEHIGRSGGSGGKDESERS
ncbi:MAG: relaxase/mobilization nuclease domain-containing protein [Clostridia bacterium]|nr:relaxase/mobilization nuclease domain-containing protein [Clostridia bacterium]